MDTLTALTVGGLGGLVAYCLAKGEPLPTEAQLLKALEENKPRLTHTIQIDTIMARDKKPYPISGQSLFVLNPQDPSQPVYICLNEPESDRIELTAQRTIKAPFYRFYITNAAGSGILTIIINKASVVELEAADVNVNIVAQNLGTISVNITAQTIGQLDINIKAQDINLDINVAGSGIMMPVDIQAQYITVEVDVTKWGGTALTGANITTYLSRLNVNLSTLATQATLASILAKLNVNLSTVATQATLASILATLVDHEYTTPDNYGVDVGVASTLILASNTNRLYAAIVNDSDEVIYLAKGAAAVLHQGIRLNANGGNHEINWTNLYTGAIYGIHGGAGNKRVTTEEGD